MSVTCSMVLSGTLKAWSQDCLSLSFCPDKLVCSSIPARPISLPFGLRKTHWKGSKRLCFSFLHCQDFANFLSSCCRGIQQKIAWWRRCYEVVVWIVTFSYFSVPQKWWVNRINKCQKRTYLYGLTEIKTKFHELSQMSLYFLFRSWHVLIEWGKNQM